MKKVFFKPWEGEHYAKGFNGKKILVLGDSHYSSGNESAEFTTEVVEHFLGYKRGDCPHAGYMNTYTRFTNIMFGEQADGETTIDFWQSIAFYNYVQQAQAGHSVSPTEKEYDDSQAAFIEILEEYQPDLVIVWGRRLWNKITKYGIEANFNTREKLYYLEVKGKKILTCAIPHPRVISKDWTVYLQEVMKLA